MLASALVADNLVHLAAIATLVCYLFRDQIKLRSFAVLGDLLLSAYYYFAFSVPLWTPLYWSIANVLINAGMIILLLRDRRMSLLSDNEMRLFRGLETLSPGQFRKLLKRATWHELEEESQLTTEGEMLDTLYYVLDGKVSIGKQGRILEAGPMLFIGEIAFLRDKAATATVRTAASSLYVSWKQAELRELFRKDDDLKNAMGSLLSADMADKVARS